MALIVQKFGGSSVKDRDRIFNVARIVANTHKACSIICFPFLFMQIMRTAQTAAYRNRCLNSVYPASSPGRLHATPSR